MEQFTKDKVVTPKTVYVTSTAKIFLCKNVDEDLKEQLSKWFPNYKLSQFKFATHIIAKGEKLSFEVVRGVLRRLVIYEQNSRSTEEALKKNSSVCAFQKSCRRDKMFCTL